MKIEKQEKEINESDFEDINYYEEDTTWLCNNACPHFDEINMCCWQAGKWGLCFDVDVDDECPLGYNDGNNC